MATTTKDGWNEVSINDSVTWDRESPIEGVYVSKKDNVGANESRLYVIKTDKGDVSVWDSTVLHSKFSEIEIGCKVRIEPLGEIKSEKTGRSYMDFKVFWKPFEGFEAGKSIKTQLGSIDANGKLEVNEDTDDDTIPSDFLE